MYAGSAADGTPEETGVIQRFAATVGEPGQLLLSAEGADLRLVAPGGTEGHARRFLPDSEYASVAARVLRERDGTGFFIVVPASSLAGSLLTPGQYRLELLYHRDNRSVDPGSQVLSEAGNTSAEGVTLDIPGQALF